MFTTTLHVYEVTDVILHGVSSDVMADILDFVYTRRININYNNVSELLAAADYLCLESVVALCCDYLKNLLNIENCIGIMLFARFYACTKLETDARRFLMHHFVQVSQQSEELLELRVEELQAIIGQTT
jgi:hypothetical protein